MLRLLLCLVITLLSIVSVTGKDGDTRRNCNYGAGPPELCNCWRVKHSLLGCSCFRDVCRAESDQLKLKPNGLSRYGLTAHISPLNNDVNLASIVSVDCPTGLHCQVTDSTILVNSTSIRMSLWQAEIRYSATNKFGEPDVYTGSIHVEVPANAGWLEVFVLAAIGVLVLCLWFGGASGIMSWVQSSQAARKPAAAPVGKGFVLPPPPIPVVTAASFAPVRSPSLQRLHLRPIVTARPAPPKPAPPVIAAPLPSWHIDILTDKVQRAWHHPDKPFYGIAFGCKVNLAELKYYPDFVAYRDALHQQGIVGRKNEPGNECERFHGTSARCNIARTGNLCTHPKCRACRIIENGFQMSHVLRAATWPRFGPGHYFSATASKSQDYPQDRYLDVGEERVLLVCSVLVGRGKKLYHTNEKLTGAPEGYHSVLGETGVHLNYDETVVYRDDACVVKYVLKLTSAISAIGAVV